MFSAIGRFDVRFRYLIVILWIIAVPLSLKLLPSLSAATQASSSNFLSFNAPSVTAGKLALAFEGSNPTATAVIVAVRNSGPLTAADDAAISKVKTAVGRLPGVALIRDEGVSTDGKADEIVLAASGSALSDQARVIVTDTRAEFKAVHAPAGLAFHMTGQLAEGVDATNSVQSGNIIKFTVLFIILLLFLVYRAVLAPILTLIPAGISLTIAGSLVAAASKAGLSVSSVTQELLIVLMLGAGTDYGLFLMFRVREERGRGLPPAEAVVSALGRVGETISYSALTVVAALLSLLLASFGIFRGLGPALAIGLVVLLLASLTLTPALIAIFGKYLFWPSHPGQKPLVASGWLRLAKGVTRHPVATLVATVVLFGTLMAGLAGFHTAGFSNGAPAGTDSAAGVTVLNAHFAAATAGSDELLMQFSSSVWAYLPAIARAEQELASAPAFHSVSGPLDPNGTRLTSAQLYSLGYSLGPAILVPSAQSADRPHVPQALYVAYRTMDQYISLDGKTIQFYATMRAGPPGSTAAADATPAARTVLDAVARQAGASAYGVTGQDPVTYDVTSQANSSLIRVAPVVVLILLILLALLLRSLVAPWYLVFTVCLSYLTALGVAMIVFVHLGHSGGLTFVLPFLMFVFSMALGEDYNILVMSRIREEVIRGPSFREALERAIGITGGTVTSAGIILAGTFTVLGVVGGNSQAQEIGFGIAFGVVLDTFFVRTLLIPSIATLLGRWNWWPSTLSAQQAAAPLAPAPEAAGVAGPPTDVEKRPVLRAGQS